ncbi:hypothetical protein Hanom_Chr04g00369331 [Helianthus anomalus]
MVKLTHAVSLLCYSHRRQVGIWGSTTFYTPYNWHDSPCFIDHNLERNRTEIPTSFIEQSATVE